MTAQDFLTEAEAAERLRVSQRTLRALRSKGMIRYVRPSPRKVFYKPEDVAEYLERATCQDNPPCPSTNRKKAASGTTTSGSKGSGIMDRLASRPSGMPKGLKMIKGGKHP
jgi:excisionase family DNA binding protein